jgi:hypothetical protein
MSVKIKLLCLVQGDILQRLFAVNVKPSDSIRDLRKAILAEKPTLRNIGVVPDDIEVWKVGELCWLPLVHKSDSVVVRYTSIT